MTTNFYTDLVPITTDIQPTISVSDTINTISSEITNTLTTRRNSIEDNDNDNDISIITDTRSSVYNVLTTSITITSSLSTDQLSSTAHKEVSSNNGNGNKANNYKKNTLVWGILGTSLLYSFIL
ncbi:hypothetical protein DAPK24_036870 [Pichia kluyveri]|uniref:Uncharacterized protein n=1 Tax=Pichia kluyveri TaxID=36015 RepID=A0AAV5R7W2_PICKL|nr:hypothetical protein DAPK24_036870 [Pichia kluyveri]